MQRVLDDLTDQELVSLSVAGNERCIEILLSRFHKQSMWIAMQRVHNIQDAEDVVQDAYIRLARSLHDFDTSRPFLPWLWSIVDHVAIDHCKRRRPSEIPIDSTPLTSADGRSLSESEAHLDFDLRVREVWMTLDPEERMALELRYVNDLKYKEIGKALGKTEIAARVQVHRALTKLKRKVKNET